ncbi:MAG TPA: hypothetical protein VKP00_01215, partial [Gemmatimonadaceae bacterium]|nr:hypothetical protein [Gemmatimonadaceae bacterium]
SPEQSFERRNTVSRILSAAVLAANLAISSVAAHAQAARTAHFNLAAGVTLPTGTFSDRNDAGYNLIAGLGMRQPGSALGFRVEGIYNEFNE